MPFHVEKPLREVDVDLVKTRVSNWADKHKIQYRERGTLEQIVNDVQSEVEASNDNKLKKNFYGVLRRASGTKWAKRIDWGSLGWWEKD